MKQLVVLSLLLLMILHQDYWWRADHRTLLFDFLPVSLGYHILISILSCILWGLACRYCWPRDVDVQESAEAIDSSVRRAP